MTQLTPAMDLALAGANPTVFGAIALTTPSGQVNLLDGSGILAFGGKTYVGRDPIFGVLAACEAITDGLGDTAPAVSITLLPASDAAAATLASPALQGAHVAIYVGVVDAASGQVVPDPHLVFLGEIDVPTITVNEAGRELELQVVSVVDRSFTDDEGQRLSPGRQRAIYADDAGLDDVTGVTDNIYWGVEGGPGAITYGGRSGIGGGLLQSIANLS